MAYSPKINNNIINTRQIFQLYYTVWALRGNTWQLGAWYKDREGIHSFLICPVQVFDTHKRNIYISVLAICYIF